MRKKIFIVLAMLFLFIASDVYAEEGDFTFSTDFGWGHYFSDTVKDGVYLGGIFGYDTSKHLAVELNLYYGDNKGEAGNPDLWYIAGGGGLNYKYRIKWFKPSISVGATALALKFSNLGKKIKGAMYVGTAFEFYLNRIVALGISFKYFPIFSANDITMLGIRIGLDL